MDRFTLEFEDEKVLESVSATRVYTLAEFKGIFNNFLIDRLDIDLNAYDEFEMVDYDDCIVVDMFELEDESPAEYQFIINELEDYFGDDVFLPDGITLNLDLIVKQVFENALSVEFNDDKIIVKSRLSQILA